MQLAHPAAAGAVKGRRLFGYLGRVKNVNAQQLAAACSSRSALRHGTEKAAGVIYGVRLREAVPCRAACRLSILALV